MFDYAAYESDYFCFAFLLWIADENRKSKSLVLQSLSVLGLSQHKLPCKTITEVDAVANLQCRNVLIFVQVVCLIVTVRIDGFSKQTSERFILIRFFGESGKNCICSFLRIYVQLDAFGQSNLIKCKLFSPFLRGQRVETYGQRKSESFVKPVCCSLKPRLGLACKFIGVSAD